jgi:hypothetical protein
MLVKVCSGPPSLYAVTVILGALFLALELMVIDVRIEIGCFVVGGGGDFHGKF